MTENVPVIFLTGRQGRNLKHRLYAQGSAGYLAKPVDLETQTRELNRVMKTEEPWKMETAVA